MFIFRVYKDIKCGDELLVWYGDEYAEELGIENEEQEEEKREEILQKSKYFGFKFQTWLSFGRVEIFRTSCKIF